MPVMQLTVVTTRQPIVDARDKLLVIMRRRDVEPTNNGSEQKLRPSVIFREIAIPLSQVGTKGMVTLAARGRAGWP